MKSVHMHWCTVAQLHSCTVAQLYSCTVAHSVCTCCEPRKWTMSATVLSLSNVIITWHSISFRSHLALSFVQYIQENDNRMRITLTRHISTMCSMYNQLSDGVMYIQHCKCPLSLQIDLVKPLCWLLAFGKHLVALRKRKEFNFHFNLKTPWL